jgi:ATP-dependent protease ClpP protease subunit
MSNPQPANRNESSQEIHKFLFEPNVRIFGAIQNGTFWDFMDQVAKVRETADDAVVLELNTQGGDADVARRIALELRLCREWHNRKTFIIGKSFVYSAGITIFGAVPRENRYLTEDTYLLIHERRLDSTLELKGPVRSNIQILREQLATMETAEAIEREGFADFCEGSNMSLDELYKRATNNFYLTAQEALEHRLVAGIV